MASSAALPESKHMCGACSRQNVSQGERVLSAAAGVGLGIYGLSRGKAGGLLLAAMGGGLIYRAVTGYCHTYAALGINTEKRNSATAVPAQQGAKVEKTVTVNRPAQELYCFWRDLANLPSVMQHLKRVETIDSLQSHWVAETPLGTQLEWDAEIINERENEMIAWASLPGSEVDTAGSVHFKPRGGAAGTDVVVSMKYNPPGGKIVAHVARWLDAGLEETLQQDLQRFKRHMESEHAGASGPSVTAKSTGIT
jgi:uncharacterized membrane protein